MRPKGLFTLGLNADTPTKLAYEAKNANSTVEILDRLGYAAEQAGGESGPENKNSIGEPSCQPMIIAKQQ